jgi:hypothetical protein
MYRHPVIRLSDIYNVVNLVKKGKVNWEYLFENAENAGMRTGLSFLLYLADRLYFENCHISLLPDHIAKYVALKNTRFSFKSVIFPYRLPLSFLMLIYLTKFFSDLGRSKLSSALRLLAVPMLASLHMLSFKLFGAKLIW